MGKKKLNVTLGDLVPVIAFVVIFVFFTIASKGRMLSTYNLQMLLEQSMQVIILGCGMMFVIAQGSIDLSVGVTLAVSGILANYVANVTGMAFLLFPVALVVGLIIGTFNGFLVSKCHVSSFLVSIAMLIGMRGIANFLLTQLDSDAVQFLPSSLLIIDEPFIKIPAFIIIVAICAYCLEYTRIGRYSKSIGENETTAKHIGIPVTRVKWLAFAISGLMAGVGALFSMASIGGTSMQMGSFMEMKTAMAIFFGTVLVTGGSTTKFYKLILGSLSITMIINGLALIGKSDSQISESVEGILLLLILFIAIKVNTRRKKAPVEEEAKPEAIPANSETTKVQ